MPKTKPNQSTLTYNYSYWLYNIYNITIKYDAKRIIESISQITLYRYIIQTDTQPRGCKVVEEAGIIIKLAYLILDHDQDFSHTCVNDCSPDSSFPTVSLLRLTAIIYWLITLVCVWKQYIFWMKRSMSVYVFKSVYLSHSFFVYTTIMGFLGSWSLLHFLFVLIDGVYCSCSSCCGCENVIVPTTNTSIADYAFSSCGYGSGFLNVIVTT